MLKDTEKEAEEEIPERETRWEMGINL